MTDRAGTSPHHRTSTSTSVPEVFASPIASPLSALRNVRRLSLHSYPLEEKKSDNVRFPRCFHPRQACPCQGFRQGSPFHLVGHSLYVVMELLCGYRAFGFNWLPRLFVQSRRVKQERIRGLTCVLSAVGDNKLNVPGKVAPYEGLHTQLLSNPHTPITPSTLDPNRDNPHFHTPTI